MAKKLFVILLLAAALAGYLYYLWEGKAAPGPLVLYGNVDRRDLSLGFRVGGRISEMLFEEGERVEKGERVAALDDETFRNEVALREAQEREIEARLLDAEKNFVRRESLRAKGSVPESDLDSAKAARDALVAALDTARAQKAIAETALADAILYASASGTVLTKVREPGEIVGAGETVYSLSLGSPYWVRAYVDEPDLGKVVPGLRVRVATDLGKTYWGTVGFVSPQAEFTPKTVETASLRTDLVFRIRIIVEDPEEDLRQGMPVTVTFPESTLP